MEHFFASKTQGPIILYFLMRTVVVWHHRLVWIQSATFFLNSSFRKKENEKTIHLMKIVYFHWSTQQYHHSLGDFPPLFLISFIPLKFLTNINPINLIGLINLIKKKKSATYQPSPDIDIKSLHGTVPGLCHLKWDKG